MTVNVADIDCYSEPGATAWDKKVTDTVDAEETHIEMMTTRKTAAVALPCVLSAGMTASAGAEETIRLALEHRASETAPESDAQGAATTFTEAVEAARMAKAAFARAEGLADTACAEVQAENQWDFGARPAPGREGRRPIVVGCLGAPEFSRTFLVAPSEERLAAAAAQPVVPGNAFGA